MIRQQSTREIERQQSTREESKASMPPIGCALEKAAEYPREWKAAEYREFIGNRVPIFDWQQSMYLRLRE